MVLITKELAENLKAAAREVHSLSISFAEVEHNIQLLKEAERNAIRINRNQGERR